MSQKAFCRKVFFFFFCVKLSKAIIYEPYLNNIPYNDKKLVVPSPNIIVISLISWAKKIESLGQYIDL